jgi:dipeptidase E
MGKIVALGGGVFVEEDTWPAKMRPIHEKIVALTKKKNPKVLYIPTAAGDLESRIESFQKYYSKLGCTVDALRLITKRPTAAEIKAKIVSADAIYVTGGNTYHTIALWKKYGVDVLLKQAYRRGTVMAGHSAGAICWFSYGCSDSFYKKQPFKLTAMGIFPALLCPHYDSEPVRQPAVKRIMKRTPGIVAIALDEYAALEIVDDSYSILTASPEAKARRIYWKNGKYCIEGITSGRKVKSLRLLLTKP